MAEEGVLTPRNPKLPRWAPLRLGVQSTKTLCRHAVPLMGVTISCSASVGASHPVNTIERLTGGQNLGASTRHRMFVRYSKQLLQQRFQGCAVSHPYKFHTRIHRFDDRTMNGGLLERGTVHNVVEYHGRKMEQ